MFPFLRRLAVLALPLLVLTGPPIPGPWPVVGAAWADDDDNGAGPGNDSDDDGGGRGGGGRSDDSDDDGGRRGSDDDDDDDDGGGDRTDDDDDDGTRMPSGLRSLGSGGEGRSLIRPDEISAARLQAADIRALEQSGFRVIRSRATSSGIVARLAPPRGMANRAALGLAAAAAPGAVFDLSHVYSPDGTRYARSVVGMPVRGSCLSGARIGIIDTAIADHPALQGARIRREVFSASARPAAHGTAVASIIAGQTPAGGQLVARAEIYSAAVFDGRGGLIADAIDLVAALDWMADNRVPVVNLSIAGPPNALLADSVSRSAGRGMILVAAAGNGGPRGGPRYPAAYPQVVAVTATDRHGRIYRGASTGGYVDIAAPGVEVWGADLSSAQGARWTGTSFAAPFVTVELAAALAAGQVRDTDSARAWLARGAVDLGPRGRDRTYGIGLMQAQACR